MYGYIYITKNNINNKKYIGQRTWDNENTLESDTYLGSGKILKKAFNKYGKENFSKQILKVCNSKEDLNYFEKYYIDDYNAINSSEFYNIHEGGYGGNTRAGYNEEEFEAFRLKMKTARKNYSHSEETKRKISKAGLERENHMKLPKYRKMFSDKFKGENNPMYGKKMSEETKQKLKESHNGFFAYNEGKIMSESQKVLISNSMKDAWKDEDNRNKWIESKYGRIQSEETKQKMSQNAYKRYNSFPMDDNVILYQHDKNMKLINIFNGIDEYYKHFNTKTCRNLRYAIRDNKIFKNSYWKIEFKSQSTIETTSDDGRE